MSEKKREAINACLIKDSKGEGEKEKRKNGGTGAGGEGGGNTLTSSRKYWVELYGCIK